MYPQSRRGDVLVRFAFGPDHRRGRLAAGAVNLLTEPCLPTGAHIMRVDRFNCQVPGREHQPDRLGGLAAPQQNVHDLAVKNGIGPRLRHHGLWPPDTRSVLRARGVLAALGMVASIERGPGQLGISRAFFRYLRDPDRRRCELYARDDLIPDPKVDPIRLTLGDPRWTTSWGHHLG